MLTLGLPWPSGISLLEGAIWMTTEINQSVSPVHASAAQARGRRRWRWRRRCTRVLASPAALTSAPSPSGPSALAAPLGTQGGYILGFALHVVLDIIT